MIMPQLSLMAPTPTPPRTLQMLLMPSELCWTAYIVHLIFIISKFQEQFCILTKVEIKVLAALFSAQCIGLCDMGLERREKGIFGVFIRTAA